MRFFPLEVSCELDRIEELKTLEENSSKRVFPYGALDSKYKMLFNDDEANVEAFLQWTDQKAYDDHMAIVEKNTKSRTN